MRQRTWRGWRAMARWPFVSHRRVWCYTQLQGSQHNENGLWLGSSTHGLIRGNGNTVQQGLAAPIAVALMVAVCRAMLMAGGHGCCARRMT